MNEDIHIAPRRTPDLRAIVELLKPITWFAPVWAFGCGVVSSGAVWAISWPTILLGAVLAGPLVCAMSQAVNDWYDRHVDAINEPDRPIPSGRVPGSWGFYIALCWTVLSLSVASVLGPWGLAAGMVAAALAWAYSAPPFRLKRFGWLGAATCAACYEGLPWITAAAILLNAFPSAEILTAAGLYSAGAVGIMILNDFKSVEGDRALGVASVPAQLGADRAARVACWVMAVPQVLMVLFLLFWGLPLHAVGVASSVVVQMVLMRRLLSDPQRFAPWYNGTGTLLYVLGMLVTAFALRSLGGVA